MEIKKTLTLSALLHVILFSAALLSFRGSRNMQAEDLFFVNLTEDVKRPDVQEVVGKIEKPAPSLSLKKEIKRPRIEAQPKSALPKNPEAPVRNDPGKGTETLKEVPPSEGSSIDATKSGGNGITTTTTLREIDDAHTYQGNGDNSTIEKISDGKDKGLLPDGTIELIANAIERTKAYPLLARKRGIEGTVYVSFRIDHDGRPEELVIQKSSGFGILDTATLDVIKKAAPFPYIESRVEIPVTYKLKDLN
jgi:protein TonB